MATITSHTLNGSDGTHAGDIPVTLTTQIVVRFAMHDPDGAYHMPVILNPNSYSMWSSC
jgi:5-hydroxyisourate hydrolase